MAREIKVSAAVLNIRIHPHSAELYVRLFRTVYSLRAPAQVHGDRFGLISTANFSKDGIVSGVITTFTRFDTDGTWFDVDSLEEASDEKVAEVSIPSGLFPKSATYFFHFDARSHKIYVETYSRGKTMTPPSILRLLRGLFGQAAIVKEFGQPSISIVQTNTGLEAMFAIDRIKKIEITLEKPNPDVFSDDFEEEIERHLAETHTQKMTVTYEAVPGESIVATPAIRRIGKVALENGDVTVVGRDNGVAVTKSTEKYPELLQDKYDPDSISEQQAFNRLIPKIDT